MTPEFALHGLDFGFSQRIPLHADTPGRRTASQLQHALFVPSRGPSRRNQHPAGLAIPYLNCTAQLAAQLAVPIDETESTPCLVGSRCRRLNGQRGDRRRLSRHDRAEATARGDTAGQVWEESGLWRTGFKMPDPFTSFALSVVSCDAVETVGMPQKCRSPKKDLPSFG